MILFFNEMDSFIFIGSNNLLTTYFLNILIKNKIREFDSVLNNDSLKIIISSSYSLKSKKGRKTYEILNYFNNLFKADKKHKFKKI